MHNLAYWWLHSDRGCTIHRLSDDMDDERGDEAQFATLRLMQVW
jgi:hypothetical protein